MEKTARGIESGYSMCVKEMGETREWLLVVCPLLSLSQNPFECCFTSLNNSAHVELRIF